MAWLFKRSRSKNWQLGYREDGTEKYRSTGTPNRREAERFRTEFESGQLEGNGTKPSQTELGTFLAAFLDQYKVETCPNLPDLSKTFLTVAQRLKSFFVWLEKKHSKVKYLEQVTTALIGNFLVIKRKRDHSSVRTFNHYRQAFHLLFQYAIETQAFISRNPRHPNPVTPIKKLKVPSWEIAFLTLAQIEEQLNILEPKKLQALCKAHQDLPAYSLWVRTVLQPMIAVAIYAGLRREEICWLTKRDIDLGNRIIHVREKTALGQRKRIQDKNISKGRKIFWKPKNRKNRQVPISSTLMKYLREYESQGDSIWFFPTCSGQRWMPDNLSRELRKINQTAELIWSEEDEHPGKRIGSAWAFNDFRHTFGSMLARNGVSLLKIAKLMGNSPDVCQKHYLHLIPEELRDCVEFGTDPDDCPTHLRIMDSDQEDAIAPAS